MKLIVGLGNPGTEYANTRHNTGFLAVDRLAETLGASWGSDAPHMSRIAKTKIDGQSVLLAKPQTFMNLSGDAVQAVASYYKVAPADILVVQDELDLLPGTMAFLAKGGDAGHNGIASIQERMGRTDIARLRLGIGRPDPPMKTEDWVLGKIDPKTLAEIDRATDAMTDWASTGLEKAMNTWNQKRETSR